MINTSHMQFIYQLLQGTGCSVEVKEKKIPLSWIRPSKMLTKAFSILNLRDLVRIFIGHEISITQELINRKKVLLSYN